MRRRTALGLGAAAWAALAAPAAFAQEKREMKLKAMTFNLRYASDTPPNDWPARRPVMKKLIRGEDPDLIGTQEGLWPQLKNIAEDLDDYDWIGEGRNGGSAGEFMAIFYKKKRFEPMAYGHFWLSETPDVIGSIAWEANLPRMVTWVRFKERETGLEFHLWNTHFDHQSEPARQKSGALLAQRLAAQTPVLPTIVTGDFNCGQNSVCYQTLLAEGQAGIRLIDTWAAAEKRENEGVSTFHGYRPIDTNGHRIDWVLASTHFKTSRAAILTLEEGGQYPSDHFPVVAELTLTVEETKAPEPAPPAEKP